jgi:Spx/MgsR family transcriptional regulator
VTTLYGIPNCDTIKRCKKWLDDHHIEYEFHDYKKQQCPEELIITFLTHFDYKDLINTRGTTWRKLPDAVKNSVTEKIAISLMQEQPSMIKRPIIETSKTWLLGYNEQKMTEVFLK